MTRTRITLRIVGDELPSTEALTEILGCSPTEVHRKGERIGNRRRLQSTGVCLLELGKYYNDTPCDQVDALMLSLTERLNEMAPRLAALDRSQFRVDFYISILQEEDQGGLFLPPELVAAAAAAGTTLQVSLIVMFYDDEEEEDAGSQSGAAGYSSSPPPH